MLIDSYDHTKKELDQQFELFGALNSNSDEKDILITAYFKELENPISQRESQILAMLKI